MVDILDIGKRLKEERERLGFNQSDFGALASIGRKSQFSYETGASMPDASYLAAIDMAAADIRYIVTGERDGPPPLKPDEQALLDGYRTLNTTTKRRILAFMRP